MVRRVILLTALSAGFLRNRDGPRAGGAKPADEPGGAGAGGRCR